MLENINRIDAMMNHQKPSARSEYRLQESERVKNSATLSDKYRQLKTLTVELEYHDSDGLSHSSQIKYTVNLDNARSVFRSDCNNGECVAGDFDLSEKLAEAVADRRTTESGEMTCQGWQSKATIGTVHCRHILRYRLTLGY